MHFLVVQVENKRKCSFSRCHWRQKPVHIYQSWSWIFCPENAVFFIFKHSWAPIRYWKIIHGGPGKSWIFVSKRLGSGNPVYWQIWTTKLTSIGLVFFDLNHNEHQLHKQRTNNRADKPRAQPRFKNWGCPIHVPSKYKHPTAELKGIEGMNWEGCPPPQLTRASGERRKLSQRGPQTILRRFMCISRINVFNNCLA